MSINILGQILEASETTDPQLALNGNRYSFILMSFPIASMITKLKDENPLLPVILFSNPYFEYGDSFWLAPNQEALDAARALYGLVEEDDDPILFGGDPNIPLMDISNSLWQVEFAEEAKKHTDASGADGFFLDTIDETLPNWATGPLGELPKGYTESGWATSINTFFDGVVAEFAGTAEISTNSATRAPSISGIVGDNNQNVLAKSDSVSVEAYGVGKPLDEAGVGNVNKDWYFHETIMKDMLKLVSLGKPVFIEANGLTDDIELRLFSLCSFLLIEGPSTHFYFTTVAQSGTLVWRTEWETNIGSPIGDFYIDNKTGIYSRDFINGKVLVNPTPMTIKFNVIGSYVNYDTSAINNPITIAPYNAKLLLKN